MTSDQLHWDRAYEAQQQPELQSQPSDFAVAVADQLGHEDIVLELGCGAGIDAAYLAARVRSITAVDFAEKQIQLNQATLKQPNLTFTALDITRDLNRFPDASYSAVYARRSLHYFDKATTKQVFREIHRILAPEGRFFFECKSIHDPHAGQLANIGDVHQFFSDEELQDYLAGFEIEFQEEKAAQDFYGFPSVFLTCWAQKKPLKTGNG